MIAAENGILAHWSAEDLQHELRGFPEPTRMAALQLRESAAPGSLESFVLRVLEFYLPKGTERDLRAQPKEARLREDLGIDSLAFSEAAFKFEDLFGVRLENSELAALTTLADLKTYMEAKLGFSVVPN